MPDYESLTAAHSGTLPLTESQLVSLAERCCISGHTRMLLLPCGRAELLCAWAKRYGLRGTGVDLQADLIRQAQERADEMGVWSQLQFVVDDIAIYAQPFHQFHVVALFESADPPSMIANLHDALHVDGAFLLLGMRFPRGDHAMLEALLDTAAEHDLELRDLIVAEPSARDSHEALRWQTALDWLAQYPDHPDASALRRELDQARRSYLLQARTQDDWALFVFQTGLLHPCVSW